jgi:hypothetical protein
MQLVVNNNQDFPERFVAAVGTFIRIVIKEYGFPPHRLIDCWARRDVVLFHYSRDLYGWEEVLAEKQGEETNLISIWRQNPIKNRIVARWNSFSQKNFDASVNRIIFFSRSLHEHQEYGYIFCNYNSSVFASPFSTTMGAGLPLQHARGGVWSEESINLELCRTLRSDGGKGPDKCRVLVLDDQHFVFLLSGFLGCWFSIAANHDSRMVQSVTQLIIAHLRVCIKKMFDKMGIAYSRCDIDLQVDKNEAVVLVIL